MTPDDLKRALVQTDGQAVSTCLAALAAPNAIVRTEWADRDPTPTSHFLEIYRTRADHVEQIGLPTLGFREAVLRLESTSHATLRLVSVEGANGYPYCFVFLAPDEATVVATLAVLGPTPPA